MMKHIDDPNAMSVYLFWNNFLQDTIDFVERMVTERRNDCTWIQGRVIAKMDNS